VLVDPRKLMGRAEIQKRLGVGYSRVRVIIARPDFPAPLPSRLTMGRLWDGVAVEAWIAVHRKPTEDDTEG
jgi:prophage regulatory protein